MTEEATPHRTSVAWQELAKWNHLLILSRDNLDHAIGGFPVCKDNYATCEDWDMAMDAQAQAMLVQEVIRTLCERVEAAFLTNERRCHCEDAPAESGRRRGGTARPAAAEAR